jgi:uncharacterized membrane-anchored protein
MNHEDVIKVARRLERVKDMDPDYARILNDAHDAIIQLMTDLATARNLYNEALETVYSKTKEEKDK